jgi:hypothetical protein
MFFGVISAAAAFAFTIVAAFPNAPFYTDGRWIKDSTGFTFTYAGVNWPGAADTMLPEGLQYQSVSSIVSKIKGSGFNIIRLTFAIEMIDEIFENDGADVPVKTAFINALGVENGTRIFHHVLANNPSFNENITRLQVRNLRYLMKCILKLTIIFGFRCSILSPKSVPITESTSI